MNLSLNNTSFIKRLTCFQWFIVFASLLSIYRLFLITVGHFFWTDELRYMNAFLAWNHLLDGDIKQTFYYIFNAHGRPGFIIFSMIPAAVQLIAIKAGLLSADNVLFLEHLYRTGNMSSHFNPQFFNSAAVYNVLVSVLILFVLFKFVELLTKSQWWAFCASFCYGLMANSNVYIRHFCPYDTALLLFLVALYVSLKASSKDQVSFKVIVICSILCFLAFITYSSYAIFILLVLVSLLSQKKDRWIHLFSFLSIFILLFIIVESLALYSGRSFLIHSLLLSSSVVQGDFHDGFIFIFKYLFTVEGLFGVTLLTLFGGYVFKTLLKQKNTFGLIVLLLIGCYLLYAINAVVFHKLVLYGRTIHMFIPIMIICAVVFLQSLKNKNLQNGLLIVMLMTSILNFSIFAYGYTKLSYPIDFKHPFLSQVPSNAINTFYEGQDVNKQEVEKALVVIVNAIYMHPISDGYELYYAPEQFELKKVSLHPLNHPIYQYEGHSFSDREKIKQRKYQMKVYTHKLSDVIMDKINRS